MALTLAWGAFYGSHPIGAIPFVLVIFCTPVALLIASLLIRLTKQRNRMDRVTMFVSGSVGALLLCFFAFARG
jgi:hypothetical protein